MREYKFRGKRIDGKGWVYGSLLQSEIGVNQIGVKCQIHERFADSYSITQYDVLPETVGQWIGLKDKNAVEIYDGDIVESGNGEIFWNNRASQFMIRWHEKTFKRIRGRNPGYNNGEALFYNSEIAWSVIGNIHDHPHLLNPPADSPAQHTMDPNLKPAEQNEQATEQESAGAAGAEAANDANENAGEGETE